MNIKDIEKLTRTDIMDMSTEQLEKTLREITKQVKRREASLKKAHMRYSPALRNIKKGGFYKETAKDTRIKNTEKQEAKYRGKLMEKIGHGKQFLGNQTSTIKGMRKVNKELKLRLELTHEPSERFLKRYWEIYEKLKHYLDELGNYLTSEELQEEIYKRTHTWHIKGSNWREKEDNIISDLEKKYDDIAKQIRQDYEETDTFALGEDEEDEDEDFPW